MDEQTNAMKDKKVYVKSQKRTTKNLFFFILFCVGGQKRKCGKREDILRGNDNFSSFFRRKKKNNGDRLIYIDFGHSELLAFHQIARNLFFFSLRKGKK